MPVPHAVLECISQILSQLSVSTRRRRQTPYGLSVRPTYSDINEQMLQEALQDVMANPRPVMANPNTGYESW